MTTVTTTATYKTKITADLPDWPSSDVTFQLVADFFTGSGEEVLAGKTYTMTLDANGNDDGAFYLPTPDNTGTTAVNWRLTLPSGYEKIVTVAYSATAQSVHDLIAAGATTTDPDTITTLFNEKQDKDADATNDNLAIFASGQTVDSGTALTAVGNATKLQGRTLASTAPTDGQVVAWNDGAEQWEPADAASGGATYYTILVDAAGGGDYATLSAALAAASAGDAIFIRNGTYDGGFDITLDDATLIGESRNGVIIQSPADSTTPGITVSGDRVTLENIKVDGRRDLQTSAGAGDVGSQSYSGVYVTGTDCLIQNCWIFEPRGMGVVGSSGAHRGRIVYSRIENRATNGSAAVAGAYSYGMLVTGTTARWQIAFNTITGWSQGVGLWFGANDCAVAFNRIIDNYGYLDAAHTLTRSACEDYGSSSYAAHGNNLWIGNTIDGSCSECIECAQGTIGSKFIGNVLKNPNKFGNNTGVGFKILTGTAAEPTRDILFEANTLIGDATATVKTGGYVATLGNVQIINNTFIDCQNTGNTGVVLLEGASTAAVIAGNMFKNCAGGIYLNTGIANGQNITGNVIGQLIGAGLYGLFFGAGSDHIVTGNKINTTAGRGIYIGASASRLLVSDNNVTCALLPVNCQGADNVIENNHLYGTSTVGAGCVKLDGGSALRNLVTKNTFRSGDNYADVVLANSADYNIIQNNRLLGKGSFTDGSGAAHNIIEPNHTATVTKAITMKALGAQTVGASQATIAHGLGYTPTEIQITMTSAGTMWRSAASDGTNIYLTADSAGRTADVFVR